VQATKTTLKTIWVASVGLIPIAIAFSLSGCVRDTSPRNVVAADSASRAAVLRLRRRTQLGRGCRYGLTLTNNLVSEIRDLPLRFTAIDQANMRLQTVTRGFFGIKPTLQQYVEISFVFNCSQIRRIEVGGFGRCMVGELTLRSARPGSCLDLVDVLPSQFVNMSKTEEGSP